MSSADNKNKFFAIITIILAAIMTTIALYNNNTVMIAFGAVWIVVSILSLFFNN